MSDSSDGFYPGVRISTDDSVSGLAAHRGASGSYLAVGVGHKVLLYDSVFHPLATFDITMKKSLFRSLAFSPDGSVLAAVDGENILHLLAVPDLAELHSSPASRAVFFKDFVVTARDDCVFLHDSTAEFKEIRASAAVELRPHALATDGELIFYAGDGPDNRPRLLCMNENLKMMWLIIPRGSVITALAVTDGGLAAATVDGDVLIFNREGGIVRDVQSVHSMAVTSMTAIPGRIATGSLDGRVCLTNQVMSDSNPSLCPAWIFSEIVGLIVALAGVLLVVFEPRQLGPG
jgi:WD40 repeat protein